MEIVIVVGNGYYEQSDVYSPAYNRDMTQNEGDKKMELKQGPLSVSEPFLFTL